MNGFSPDILGCDRGRGDDSAVRMCKGELHCVGGSAVSREACKEDIYHIHSLWLLSVDESKQMAPGKLYCLDN